MKISEVLKKRVKGFQLNWKIKLNCKSTKVTTEGYFNTEMNSSHEKGQWLNDSPKKRIERKEINGLIQSC